MDIYKLEFLPKYEVSEEHEELLWDYLSSLYKNGQIMEDYNIIEQDNKYVAIITLPEKVSLDNIYCNEYVRQYREKVTQRFEISNLEYFGKNINMEDVCTCNNPSWYLMYTDYARLESPISCGDCGKGVPLYRLPKYQDEREYYTMLEWQRAYNSFDRLYMYSICDRFILRHLNNPKSELFKIGLDIRRDLEVKLHRPVYYYVFYASNYSKKVHSKECPICNNHWNTSLNESIVDRMCYRCRLATDIC